MNLLDKMKNADWKKTLGTVAPGIATMLGGPLAGTATTALLSFFNIDPQSPDAEEQLKQAVKAMTPAQMIELKKVENNLVIELKKAEIDVFNIEAQDRQSARQEHRDSMVPGILTFGFFAAACYIVWSISTAQQPVVDEVLWGTVIGYVFSEVKQSSSFWMGTSFSSAKKNDTITKAMNR